MLVCSDQCAKEPLREIVPYDPNAHMIGPAETHTLLSRMEIASLLEVRRVGDGFLEVVDLSENAADRVEDLLGKVQ
jgi:hypothetical protein